jgi:rRNA maturation endonuclease Nob1
MRVRHVRRLVAMSVIGYVVQCDACNARMLVTADYKNAKFCPECLDEFVKDAIEQAMEDEQ